MCLFLLDVQSDFVLFWHSVVRCVNIKYCYAFLENWSLYVYVMSFLPLMISLVLKYALSGMDIVTLTYFCLVLAWYIFQQSLIFLTYLRFKFYDISVSFHGSCSDFVLFCPLLCFPFFLVQFSISFTPFSHFF